jgi:hypothetical protein
MTSRGGKYRTMHWLLPVFVALATAWAVRPRPAHAATPAAVCARIGTDDTLRPIPESLVPEVNAAFGTAMPTRLAMDATVFRCAAGRLLVCTTGANLPCGPANTSRTPGPGAVAWCRDHANAAFIPAVATGHDTIFAWRCQGAVPQPGQQVLEVDRRGFIANYWQMLP